MFCVEDWTICLLLYQFPLTPYSLWCTLLLIKMARPESKEPSSEQNRIVIVEKLELETGNVEFAVASLDKNSKDPLAIFLRDQAEETQKHINDLSGRLNTPRRSQRLPVSGRMPPLRQVREGRENISDEIEKAEAKLRVLKGEELQPLRVEVKKGRMVSSSPSHFESKDHHDWFRFVVGNLRRIGEISSQYPHAKEVFERGFTSREDRDWFKFIFDNFNALMDDAAKHPQAIDLYETNFRLRHRIRFGDNEQKQAAQVEREKFNKEYMALSDEEARILAPMMAKVSAQVPLG